MTNHSTHDATFTPTTKEGIFVDVTCSGVTQDCAELVECDECQGTREEREEYENTGHIHGVEHVDGSFIASNKCFYRNSRDFHEILAETYRDDRNYSRNETQTYDIVDIESHDDVTIPTIKLRE